MRLDALHRTSLRRTLTVVLMAGVLAGSVLQVLATWRTADAAVNAAFDRSLYGAIRAIDASISTESGGIGVELPYVLLEFFELTASGPVHYRVATEDGLVEIGSPDIPMPDEPTALRTPHFQTVDYVDGPARVGTYVRPLDEPASGNIVIQVAESLASRAEFSRQFILQAVIRDVLLAVLAAAMVAMTVSWSLRPLKQLREGVQARQADDLSPIDTARVPVDVLPLVQATNDHLGRYRTLLATQRRFLDDASHQLRTPLTTLLTQAGYALREPDDRRVRETMEAMRVQLRTMIRRVNQLLVLARADTSPLQSERTDLAGLAGELVRRLWPVARRKAVDLGLEHEGAPVMALAHAGLVQEALSNLVDNALRHTPAGGSVTVGVRAEAGGCCIDVTDDGPGIPEDELPLVTQRFFRASNAQGEGTGLGLAIVQSIATRLHGRLELARAPAGGLRASLWLPAAPPRGDQAAGA
ncbi:sensor histidine kinase [Pseudacidovorax intermedius]|uniref:sensor histidine kinase n=1 Tax=Pseudacidovorax intermedius TaxID=433924 RepID=UPI0025FE1081|nr:sensor histidine kinase [Pseudacidovorax intermedius]